jgi:hypothetical protein
LFKQPSAVLPYSCDPLPGPYFEQDPRLDRPELPQPGWFGDAEIGVVGPHVKNKLTDNLTVGTLTNTVSLPSADLNWTVSPRIEIGYRLPSGFGDFAVSYRNLATKGTTSTIGFDGPGALDSQLEVHIVGLDYISRELSLWPSWGMRWRFGLRFATIHFDSLATEPFGEAAAGSGIFRTQVTNSFWGIGPHVGLELERKLGPAGLALVASVEGASLVGHTRQVFFEDTVLGPGQDRLANWQTVPVLNLQVGLGWEPPGLAHSHFFLGYEYEYWWDAGRLSNTFSRGEMSDQGVLFRAEINF